MESYVDVPITLDELRAWGEEFDDVEVEVVKGAKQATGNIACGHSAACVVSLPIMVADAAFPSHYREATVTQGEQVVYRGLFEEGGQLLQASVRSDGVERRIEAFRLEELDRKIVVVISRAEVDAEGKAGDAQPVAIQEQIDLLTPYRQLLKSRTGQDRLDALLEALNVLDDEASGLAQEFIRDPESTPAERTQLLSKLCSHPQSLLALPENRKRLVDQALAVAERHEEFQAMLSCFAPRAATPKTHRRPIANEPLVSTQPQLLKRAIESLCALDDPAHLDGQVALFVTWAELDGQSAPVGPHDPIAKAIAECADDQAQALLRLSIGAPVSLAEVQALLSEDEYVLRVARRLDANETQDYQALVYALDRLQGRSEELVALALDEREAPPARAEALLWVKRLAQGEGRRPKTAAVALRRLHEADPSVRAVARQQLEQLLEHRVLSEKGRLEKQSGDQQPTSTSSEPEEPGRAPHRPSTRAAHLHAGLVVVGQRDHQLPLIRHLFQRRYCAPESEETLQQAPTAAKRPVPQDALRAPSKRSHCRPESPWLAERLAEVYSPEDALRHALRLTGCPKGLTDEQWLQAVEQPANALGVVCQQGAP